MMNPIKRIRKEKGLTVYSFGYLAGVSAGRISQIENGATTKLPASILQAVQMLGYDPAEIQKEYIEWRQERKLAVLSRFLRH